MDSVDNLEALFQYVSFSQKIPGLLKYWFKFQCVVDPVTETNISNIEMPQWKVLYFTPVVTLHDRNIIPQAIKMEAIKRC